MVKFTAFFNINNNMFVHTLQILDILIKIAIVYNMTRRPRPQIVNLTDHAANQVRQIMSDREAGYLRVGVKNGGCAGMEYVMDYVKEPSPNDEIVRDKDIEIVIDAKAVLFLFGAEIDFEQTLLHEKFVFNNPNQSDACGCGESVTIIPAVM